ncbi:hypothetical protein [Paenibacillus riograndensis]|uniref:Uncharacterized protein n=2 Tax=Paenibacillus riograndensis TaxID=483937 RepID=A0A132UBV1_9BACL|nr:hypothetical protein [Paenibacillus riograndensis]KWX74462.1 hypothetical protein AMQ83_36380 [Paenibacillus riograndensis]KWX81050.1 hypothetical protein AMQ84_01300 [Paenibacillus riograndensis]CQR57004.1 hypothetical protein PRIO_4602 [Paenibacillus riograndensis SBR5]
MLNVRKLANIVEELLEIDPYIPIKIRWGKWNEILDPTIYWRTGDFKKSLIEIGISSESGLIRTVTVVHSDKIISDSTGINWPDIVQEGTPIFKVSNWPENGRLDENGAFEIWLSKTEVNLVLSKNTIVKKVISGRVCFGLDSCSNVCLVSVCTLSDEEEMQVKDTLEYMIRQNQI